MEYADLVAGINMLAQEMEHEPDDLHEVHLKLREMLNELKATGMPLPEDLVRLDRQLDESVEGVVPANDA